MNNSTSCLKYFVLSITFLLLAPKLGFAQGGFCKHTCADVITDGCYSCSPANDYVGEVMEIRFNPTIPANFDIPQCGDISSSNDWYYFSFIASEESVEIEFEGSNYFGPATHSIGFRTMLLESCSDDCLDYADNCGDQFAPVTLSSSDLEVGKIYYVFVVHCWASVYCDVEIVSISHETFELDEYKNIAVFESCEDFCLLNGCGQVGSCDDDELYVCSGGEVIFMPLHKGNSIPDFGVYDDECQVYDPSLGDLSYQDINFTWTVDGDNYSVIDPINSYGLQYTLPIVYEETMVVVCLTSLSSICSEFDSEICINLIVEPAEEEIFHFSVCGEIQDFDPTDSDLDPNFDGIGWIGPDEFTLSEVESWENGCNNYEVINENCGCIYSQTICIDLIGSEELDTTQLFLFECQFDSFGNFDWNWPTNDEVIEIKKTDTTEVVVVYEGSSVNNWDGQQCDSSFVASLNILELEGGFNIPECEGGNSSYQFALTESFLAASIIEPWPDVNPDYAIDYINCTTGNIILSTRSIAGTALIIDDTQEICVKISVELSNGIMTSDNRLCESVFGPYTLQNNCVKNTFLTCPEFKSLSVEIDGKSHSIEEEIIIDGNPNIFINLNEDILPDEGQIDWYYSSNSNFIPIQEGTYLSSYSVSSNWKSGELAPKILAVNYGNTAYPDEYMILSSGSELYVDNLVLNLNPNCDTTCPSNCQEGNYGEECPWLKMNTGLLQGCDNLIPVGPGDYIPPNSFLVILMNNKDNVERKVSDLCSMEGCIYVLFSECERCLEAFSSGPDTSYTIEYLNSRDTINYTSLENYTLTSYKGTKGNFHDSIPYINFDSIAISSFVDATPLPFDCTSLTNEVIYLKGVVNSEKFNSSCCSPITQTVKFRFKLKNYFEDNDGDGFGNFNSLKTDCTIPMGYVTNSDDCDDENANINPSATEIVNNTIDEDCDGLANIIDNDMDGYNSNEDCNDNNPFVYPGAIEICNDVDDNCDGQIDEGLIISTYYEDRDMDGFGVDDISISSCSQPNGYVLENGDCNDNDSAINPTAIEIENNGVDENCDGIDSLTDLDNDGFDSSIDCDDNNPLIYPGASESCNGIDDNCNDLIDEGLILATYYEDRDIDGFGVEGISISSCSLPSGYALDFGDCNDSNSTVYPGAEELCDEIDNNCNGTIDEGITVNVYYVDADSDGYGDPNFLVETCLSSLLGHVENAEDCDDNNAGINPGIEDIPDNGIDEDCDGLDASVFVDGDGDGITNETDCNDNDASIYPGAEEICDEKDNDCNGLIDDDLILISYYRDADFDGFGDPLTILESCDEMHTGFVKNADDCDDTNDEINPDAVEIPNNGIDEDCDGMDLVSTHELAKSTITIYPNPARNQINLDIDGQLDFTSIIYNLQGNIIATSKNLGQLYLDNIASGLYLLEIRDNNSRARIVERIVIKK